MLALVTGASSGIGREMARVLAENGYDLILTARNEIRLARLKSELEKKGVKVHVIAADLSRRQECFDLYEKTKDRGVDFLINCAGLGVYGKFCETSLEKELNLIDVNITALHILTKLFLRDMAARDSGIILNVGSSAGFMAGPTFSSYYASKNYVVRLTEAIHEELRHDRSHVKISVLCPGPVATEFDSRADVKKSMHGLDPADVARIGIEGALKGKMVIVPGTGMKLGLFFTHLMPEHLMTAVTYRIQSRKAGKKSL